MLEPQAQSRTQGDLNPCEAKQGSSTPKEAKRAKHLTGLVLSLQCLLILSCSIPPVPFCPFALLSRDCSIAGVVPNFDTFCHWMRMGGLSWLKHMTGSRAIRVLFLTLDTDSCGFGQVTQSLSTSVYPSVKILMMLLAFWGWGHVWRSSLMLGDSPPREETLAEWPWLFSK